VVAGGVLMVLHQTDNWAQSSFTMLPWLKKIHGKVCHLLAGRG
jgi:hypothetical protein